MFNDGRRTNIEDYLIIRAVVDGDPEAYAELVRRHHPRVLRLCLSMLLNMTEAEDAAQEIFVKAFASLPRFTQDAAFLTWITRIGTNHCLDILRKRKRQRTDSLDGMLDRSAKTGAPIPELAENDPSAEARNNQEFAFKLLGEITPEERQILILREIEGLSYDGIAAVLKCTVEAVRARLRRARLQIQEKARHFLEAGTSVE